MKNKQLTYYLFILFAIVMQSVSAQEYTESELKSAYLYNFTKFVEWPAKSYQKTNGVFDITVFDLMSLWGFGQIL